MAGRYLSQLVARGWASIRRRDVKRKWKEKKYVPSFRVRWSQEPNQLISAGIIVMIKKKKGTKRNNWLSSDFGWSSNVTVPCVVVIRDRVYLFLVISLEHCGGNFQSAQRLLKWFLCPSKNQNKWTYKRVYYRHVDISKVI